jgi:MazG family protein
MKKRTKKQPVSESLKGLKGLIKTVRMLRHPKKGCPWDLEQTHESLTKYLIEESHEFIDSLRKKGIQDPDTQEELSDVLLQICLHAEMAREKRLFDLDKLARITAQKIRDRHPHVFDPDFPRFKTAKEVNLAWESIKANIRKKKQKSKSKSDTKRSQNAGLVVDGLLESIPVSLPSIQRAQRMGEKMATQGFDWPNPESCFAKLHEELNELKNAPSEVAQQEECGDLLFAIAQWLRLKKWDAEEILERSNQKFVRRCRKMEESLLADGQSFETVKDIESLERYWELAKKV